MSAPRALWLTGPGRVELRGEPEPVGEVVVATLWSGISRGTEALVARGGVPEAVRERMRAPFQQGDFPFPVKYGYAAVGRALTGPAALRGRTVFVLHPHQDRFAVPASACLPVPDDTPTARAVIAANLETALNVVWDAGVGPGDRVAVVGAGVVGALAAWLCAGIPGAEATLVDVNPDRAGLAARLGCGFAAPADAPADCDVAINASGSAAGLATALAAAGEEATVVEASWHGNRDPVVPLGAAFHARRLRLVSSQVGRVPAGRAPRWTNRRRLAVALALAADPALDALISGETPFAELPARYAGILDDPATLCHRVRYL
ncbi:zinc-binding alcohol dehydrogenase [Amaricoccus sp.]|uniref:zinc-dependent alcohol dehydrogenase n=1 Tax=Amaricoccus sp. TaxID=1872485 RepID=UPI001B55D90F|nr:zinc-binding alcohol dehydrogenase [Amaricoccus sp.]MBP7242020.1 zinc-binding alcohol dehydrogenase [Amaricoccus sp.]